MSASPRWGCGHVVWMRGGGAQVSSGTGAFARARGSVEGGGFLEFTATGVDSALFYVVRVK